MRASAPEPGIAAFDAGRSAALGRTVADAAAGAAAHAAAQRAAAGRATAARAAGRLSEAAAGDGLLGLAGLLAGEKDVRAVLQGLARRLAEVTQGGRVAVLSLDDGWLRTVVTFSIAPAVARRLESRLTEEPLVRQVLAGGSVRWAAPAIGGVLKGPLRRAFRSGRSLLLVPLPCGASEGVGIALVEGVPAELDQAQLRRTADLAAQVAVVARSAVLVDSVASERSRQERVSLATELHDGVLQQLFSVQLKLRELEGQLPGDGPVREVFTRIADEVGASSRDLRAAVVGLTSAVPRAPVAPTSGGEGLMADLEASLELFAGRTGVSWDLHVRGAEASAPGDHEAALFVRAAREGLMNVHKHANATQVAVVVRRGPAWWTLEIHDDGVTDANVLRRRIATGASTFGLRSLQEAAAQRGGRVWIGQSSELDGVQLSISLPVAEG